MIGNEVIVNERKGCVCVRRDNQLVNDMMMTWRNY